MKEEIIFLTNDIANVSVDKQLTQAYSLHALISILINKMDTLKVSGPIPENLEEILVDINQNKNKIENFILSMQKEHLKYSGWIDSCIDYYNLEKENIVHPYNKVKGVIDQLEQYGVSQENLLTLVQTLENILQGKVFSDKNVNEFYMKKFEENKQNTTSIFIEVDVIFEKLSSIYLDNLNKEDIIDIENAQNTVKDLKQKYNNIQEFKNKKGLEQLIEESVESIKVVLKDIIDKIENEILKDIRVIHKEQNKKKMSIGK